MTTRTVSRRATRVSALLAAAAALLTAVVVVWHGAYAGFADSTAPAALPTLGTARVVLADDDAQARLFTMAGMKPGNSSTRCIAVTSSSTVPTEVRLYGTGRSSTNGLSAQLAVQVELVSGGSSANCTKLSSISTAYTGTLAALPTDSWDRGVASWTPKVVPNGSDVRVYRITCTLSSSAPASAQSGTATITFVWEAQVKPA